MEEIVEIFVLSAYRLYIYIYIYTRPYNRTNVGCLIFKTVMSRYMIYFVSIHMGQLVRVIVNPTYS